MPNQTIQGFTRDSATGALVVTGVGGGGGAETDPIATAALATHEADTTNIHGILDTSKIVVQDSQLLAANSWPIVQPFVSGLPTSVAALAAANRIFSLRCIVPKTGILHDVAVWAGGTQAGNHIAAIYDVGEALAGSITKLWDSGSVTGLGANGWRVIGDPALAVVAGQNICLAFITDSTTATFGRIAMGNSPGPWQSFPDGFLPQPNALPVKPVSQFTVGSLTAPASILDSSLSGTGTGIVPYLIARVA